MSFSNTQFECNCVSTMIKYYKWLFQVDEEEEKKEEVSGLCQQHSMEHCISKS